MRPWQLAAALAVVTVGVISVLEWRNLSQRYDAGHMLERLPLEGSVKVWVDFDQLRASGLLDLLAGSSAAEDPDYKSFTQQIGFDYRTDLQGVAAAFRKDNTYFSVHGKFDFKKLDDYAAKQQGHCVDAVCSMPASQPGRFVSFYPLAGEALALAVSGEPEGVRMIAPSARAAEANPRAPVWISAPGSSFSGLAHLPAGAQAFLSPLADTVESSFSIGPTGDGGKDLRIQLDSTCPSADVAVKLAAQLSSTTDLLRKMLQRDHLTPGKSDLTSLFSSGRFEVHDARVSGTWPLDRKLLENLLAGK